jgi:hypothetical protein
MVLLHDSEKEIGLKSAIEGAFLSSTEPIPRLIAETPLAIGICFSMTDVFRSEILAVVMQQIMDEPVLPVLFLRTVSSPLLFDADPSLSYGDTGYPGGDNIQVPCWLCINHSSLATDHEEDMDKSATVGRVYPMRKGYRSSQFWSTSAVTQGPTPRTRRQTAKSEVGSSGLCDQEGHKQDSCYGLSGYLW